MISSRCLRKIYTRFAICTTLVSLISSTYAQEYHWPSPQYDTLEDFLYEGQRADGSSLTTIVHPCKKRTGTNASIAAEWIRLAYHDVATHDINAGTGGLDNSIAYELDNESNVGTGMSNSLGDFVTFSNKYISRADMVAIGVVFGTATCGGPVVPFQGGRLDAYAAGPQDVPDPNQDLATHTQMFARQGFSQSDMIQLVACGHTLGGVRNPDFPGLVAQNPVNPSLPNVQDFDGTDSFDNSIVLEYLNGTTADPLVVSSNATMTSDLRIFSSDGNATMQGLTSPDTFAETCKTIFARMINTVPSNVTLTNEIALIPAKVSAVQLTVENNQMVLRASLRLSTAASQQTSTNQTVKILWCDRYGPAQNCTGTTRYTTSAGKTTVSSPVSAQLGVSLNKYSFVVPIQANQSISKFWFEIDNGTTPVTVDNGGDGYEIAQDQVLFVPSLSRTDFVTTAGGPQTHTVVVAVRNDSNPSRVFMETYESAIFNYPPPVSGTVDLALNSSLSQMAGYNFYSAATESSGFQFTFDIHSTVGNGTTYTEDFRQMISITVSSPPPSTVSTVASSTIGKSKSGSSAGISRCHPWWISGALFFFGVFFGTL